jgi:hypothetical protein
LDIGISDGITTLEAVRLLSDKRNANLSAVGIDLHSELVCLRRWFVREYRSNSGNPVLAKIGPLLMTVGEGASPRQPISRRLGAWYLRCRSWRARLREIGRISLINPLARSHPDLSFESQNIFVRREDWRNAFTLIRAANIFHREYFSDAELIHGLGLLHEYLRDGGRLLISRNLAPRESPGCEEQGSIWRKTGSGFELIARIGRGSCVAELVDGFRAPQPTPAR